MEMTDARFVYEGGVMCPFCRSINIENCDAPKINDGKIVQEGNTIFQEVECYDCGRIWAEIYQLIGWESMEEVNDQ